MHDFGHGSQSTVTMLFGDVTVSGSNVLRRNMLRVYGNSQVLRSLIVQNRVLMRVIVRIGESNQRPVLRLQQGPFAFIFARLASFAMLMRLLAFGARRLCYPGAHLLVAVVTNAAFIAQPAKAARADLSERNDEHPCIAVFIFAVLMPIYVVLLILVADERKIIHRFTRKPA